MPAEGKHMHRFDAINQELKDHTLIWLLACGDFRVDSRRNDPSAQRRSGNEGTVELNAEPTAKLGGVGDRLPHAHTSGSQEDLLLDSICVRGHMQPSGCM